MTLYRLCLGLSDIGKMCVGLVLSYIYQQLLLHSTKHLLYTLLCMNYIHVCDFILPPHFYDVGREEKGMSSSYQR